MAELVIENLRVTFPDTPTAVLDIAHLQVAPGSSVAVMGPSGSGKTTLVNAITGLENQGSGTVRWGSNDIRQWSERQRDRWRARHVGVIMQDFHLFAGLSALDNVLLPARFHHWRLPAAIKARGNALLERVGVTTGPRPIELLSRGEKQRVAVARALLNMPDIIVADEPTASLDAHNGEQIAELLAAVAGEQQATLITITHDARLAALMARCVVLEKGQVREAGSFRPDRHQEVQP